jgi:GT2 family glycosyltransferase
MIDRSSPILAVVVLYNKRPAQSATLRGLDRAFSQDPKLLGEYRELLWDNSPRPLAVGSIPFLFEHRHSPRNEGVSGAYNAAASLAEAADAAWLLLLDQDTSVTPEFLQAMAAHARRLAAQDNVAAAVPFLVAGDFPLSPRRVRFGRYSPVDSDFSGVSQDEIFAANSGTLLRVAALRAVGGYSSDFWLDFSDIELFHRLHRSGYRLYVTGDARLQHDIALMDYDARMTPERYRNFLAAEGAFYDLHKSLPERLLYSARLLVRAVRQRGLRNPEFARLARRTLRSRLFRTRKSRIAAWKRANSERRGEA